MVILIILPLSYYRCKSFKKNDIILRYEKNHLETLNPKLILNPLVYVIEQLSSLKPFTLFRYC